MMTITFSSILCNEMRLPMKLGKSVYLRIGNQYNVATMTPIATTRSATRNWTNKYF